MHGRKKAKQNGRLGHFIDKPLLGGELDPKSYQRDPLHDPIISVIADRKSRKEPCEFHSISSLDLVQYKLLAVRRSMDVRWKSTAKLEMLCLGITNLSLGAFHRIIRSKWIYYYSVVMK